MESKGHFACPKCGCREFIISRNYTEHGSCEVLCRFNNQRKDASPVYDDKEYLDHEGCDTEYGEYGEEMSCRQCQFIFTDPAFHEESIEEREIRERTEEVKRLERAKESEQENKEKEAKKSYEAIIDKLNWTDGVTVEEAAHATVIVAAPSFWHTSDRSGKEPQAFAECAHCGDEHESIPAFTYPVYFAAPHLPSGREKWLDRRGLPVMLKACLCGKCRNINVIERQVTQTAA